MLHAGAIMVGGKVAPIAGGLLVMTAAAPLVAGTGMAAAALTCYATGSIVKTIAHGALNDTSVACFSCTQSTTNFATPLRRRTAPTVG